MTWYLSLRMARARASTFSVSTAVKGSNFNVSSFSPIYYIAFDEHHFNEDLQYADAIPMFRRLLALAGKNGLEFVVAMVMGQMPHWKSLSMLKKSAPPE